jgi:hypothetical protein
MIKKPGNWLQGQVRKHLASSVADPDPYVFGPPGSGPVSQRQCCGSGIRDPDFFTHPGSRIQKPQQKRGAKKN